MIILLLRVGNSVRQTEPQFYEQAIGTANKTLKYLPVWLETLKDKYCAVHIAIAPTFVNPNTIELTIRNQPATWEILLKYSTIVRFCTRVNESLQH